MPFKALISGSWSTKQYQQVKNVKMSKCRNVKKCLQRSWAKDHVNFHDVDATWLHCDCVVGMHLQCFAQIYIDIGTKFLYFQCFVTTDMFLFCKPILYSGNCRIFRDLAFGSIKTRFKAILKKLDFSAQIDFSAQSYFFHPQRTTKSRSLQCSAFQNDLLSYLSN